MAAESADDRKDALIVLGMHRSGTSAMARVLSLSGARLPARLMEPGAGNEIGHWESVDAQNLNDKVLAGVDSDWSDTFGPRQSHRRPLPVKKYIPEARQVIRENYDSADLIVLKEPRISILLDIWKEALAQEGFSTAFVIMVRHPLEVAESLRARNGLVENRSVMLWANYMLACEVGTRKSRRIFVSFDDLIQGPETVLDRIEAELGVALPRRSWDSVLDVQAFLDRTHKTYLNDAQKAEIQRYPEIKRLYDYFDAASRGDSWNADVSKDAIEWLSKLDVTVGPILKQLERQLRNLGASAEAERLEAASREQDLRAAADAIRSDFVAREAALNNSLASVLADIEEIRRREAELRNEAARQKADFEDRESSLKVDMAALEVDMVALATDAARAREMEAILRGEIVHLQDQFGKSSEASRHEFEQREAELQDRLDRVSSELEAAVHRASDAETVLVALQTELSDQAIHWTQRLAAMTSNAEEALSAARAGFVAREAELAQRLALAVAETDDAHTRASAAQAELKQLADGHAMRETELRRMLDASRNEQRGADVRISKLNEALIEQQREALRERSALDGQVLELRLHTNELEQQVLRAQADKQELSDALARSGGDIEAARRELNDTVRELGVAKTLAATRDSELRAHQAQAASDALSLRQQSADLASALADVVSDAHRLERMSALELQWRAIKRLFPSPWFAR